MATPVIYDKFKDKLLSLANTVDFDAPDTIKVMLVTNSYTPATADDFINDVSGNEVSGSNYTAGGAATTVTTNFTAATKRVFFSDVTWSQHASGFSNARYAVVYKDTGTPATSPLIMYVNLGADKGNVNGDLTLDFDGTNGALTLAG